MARGKKKEEEGGRYRGVSPLRQDSRVSWDRASIPSVLSARVCMHVYIYIYITRSTSYGRFSETFGMSEARSSRISRRNTDFSIARILAVEEDRDREPRRQDARQQRRRQRRHDLVEVRTEEEETPAEAQHRVERKAECVERTGGGGARERDADRRIGDNDGVRRTDLTWLQYTRYRPPRLPRRALAERRARRRSGEHPRIPFSTSQLQVLEDRYRRGAYLSRNDVAEMSATLRLPQSKVKIWFQNRRARQRRELLSSIVAAR